jgi:hypothetical protein
MKYFLLFVIGCSINYLAMAQKSDSVSVLNISMDGYSYFFKDDFLFLPVIKADKESLHLETRYNYENTRTFSMWGGYNFTGGEKLEYTLTPMGGIVLGDTKGLAPGMEVSLSYKKFELYSEGEYVFDFESKNNNFFYNWSDFSYSIKDWLWLGLSAQRLRSYKAPLDFQRGILIGAGVSKWEINGYLFNLDTDEPFYVLGILYKF